MSVCICVCLYVCVGIPGVEGGCNKLDCWYCMIFIQTLWESVTECYSYMFLSRQSYESVWEGLWEQWWVLVSPSSHTVCVRAWEHMCDDFVCVCVCVWRAVDSHMWLWNWKVSPFLLLCAAGFHWSLAAFLDHDIDALTYYQFQRRFFFFYCLLMLGNIWILTSGWILTACLHFFVPITWLTVSAH